jgi:DNA polymerase elongation subunit (family B)
VIVIYKNIYYDKKKNLIHLWEQIDGENLYTKIDWTPYVFLHKKELRQASTKYLSPDYRPVMPVKFKDFWDYMKYNKDNKDNPDIYENDVKPEIQFLVDRYGLIPDEELTLPDLKIYAIDIEVYSEAGFPTAEKADSPVVLITIINHSTRNKITFGIKPHNPSRPEHKFFHYPTEKELLVKFFEFFHKNPPDVLTGWNLYNYDILYLFNRSEKLFGKNGPHHKMSPLGEISKWKGNSARVALDIPGVAIIDYMSLYRKFAKPAESYKLDYVANKELEKGKLDLSHITNFKDLYINHWDFFVDYNVIDTKRVSELEDKLGYIKLVQQMSTFMRCPSKFYESQTSLIEGAMLTYFRRNNMCAPKFSRGHKDPVEGAYVKEPQQGQYNWVSDLDATSEYPTAMATLNMSLETIIGKIEGFSEEEIISCMRKKEFPPFTFRTKKANKIVEMVGEDLEMFNSAIKNKSISISPIGVAFTNTRKGHIANMIKIYFNKRLEVKKKAFDLKVNNAIDNANKITQLSGLEKSIKTMINAVYGAAGAPWSRYFNDDFQGSVTACGRHIIKTGEMYVNEILNAPLKSDKLIKFIKEINGDCNIYQRKQWKDYIIYIDTDSLFFSIEEFIKDFVGDSWDNLSEEDKEDYSLRISKCVEDYVNKQSYERTQKIDFSSAEEDFRINFKQEIIARSALFIQKKKYSLWKINDQGIAVDEMHTKGLDIIKTDMPSAIKEKLKKITDMILKGAADKELESFIEVASEELYKIPVEEIASNISINNLEKFINKDNKTSKGAGHHIKGTANYHKLLKELDLTDKYEALIEGEKVRVVYIKENQYNMETISFKIWPKEFEDMGIQVDYDKQIEKYFVGKIEDLTLPLGRNHILNRIKAELDAKKPSKKTRGRKKKNEE